jgi:cytochrome c-type biogenesis protein
MAFGSYGLGLLAGVLTALSPCVLPLLPIILGSALSAHKCGSIALVFGLVLSFVGVGLFVATVGFAVGIDHDVFRVGAAIVLLSLGVLLLVPALQNRLSQAVAPASSMGQALTNKVDPAGLGGQFLLGLVLGVVWSPCVGPTLGAAVALAAERQTLPQVAAVMALFGIGAALPMLVIGTLGREALLRWRGKLIGAATFGKRAFGAIMVAMAFFVFTGADKAIEAYLVTVSPD